MCRSSCPTQDHKTWGECARSANLRVGFCGVAGNDKTADRKMEAELNAYAAARKEGIQPRTTRMTDVKKAVALSDQSGSAYQAV